jgi:hypothetical protein
LEVVALPRHNAPGMEKSVFKSVATALSCGVEQDFESANAAVAHAKKTLLDASERRVKAWYLQSAAYSALALSAVGFAALFCCLEGEDSATMPLKQLLAVGVAGGSIGALLSVLGPRKKSKVEPFSTQQEASTDGFLRVLYGIVSGFIVAAAVQAEFVTSAIVRDSESILPSLLVAIAGGFLERWAVDIIQSTRPPKPDA